MPAIMEEYKYSATGLGVVIDVNNVDDEVTITLNGVLLQSLVGPHGQRDRYNRNITDQLDPGENLLTFTLVNFGGPCKLDGSVSVGAQAINLNQSSIGDAPPGCYYQAFVYLDV
jgi:hypothetical protein